MTTNALFTKPCDLNNCERTPEVETLRSQASFYSRILMFCLGIIVTLVGVYFTNVKNAVSRSDVDDMISKHPAVVTLRDKIDTIAAIQSEQVNRLEKVQSGITSIANKLHAETP